MNRKSVGRKSKVKRVRPKVGDVIAIPLATKQYAFGRILNDAGLAIYDRLSAEILEPDAFVDLPIRFYTGFFDNAVRDASWPVIGHIAARSANEDWQPPCFIRDEFCEGEFEIYDRGKIRSATATEVKGLEEQVMHYPKSLVEEIRRRFNESARSQRKRNRSEGHS